MSIFPTKVLLATDGSAEAERAARAAVELMGKTGSELHLIHAWTMPLRYHPERRDYPELWEKQQREARQRLDEQVERVEAVGGSVTKTYLTAGQPDAEIVAVAEDIGAGVVVMGSKGLSGLKRSLLGSVSESVVRHAHCPVLVVRSPGREADAGQEAEETSIFPKKILFATDGSQSSAHALREAADLTNDTGSELHVVHVMLIQKLYLSAGAMIVGGIDLYDKSYRRAERVLAEGVERAKEAGAPAAEAHLLEGKPDAEVVALAEEIGAGLIVVGSRGLGALTRALVGSTSASIVRHAHCPVMVIRDEEKELA